MPVAMDDFPLPFSSTVAEILVSFVFRFTVALRMEVSFK